MALFEDFNRNISDEGDPIVEQPGSRQFRDMFWLIKILSETLDFSKRFRVIVDYDPDRDKVLIRKYYQNGEIQSVLAEVEDNRIL